MNNLLDPIVAEETKHRIFQRSPDSERQWVA